MPLKLTNILTPCFHYIKSHLKHSSSKIDENVNPTHILTLAVEHISKSYKSEGQLNQDHNIHIYTKAAVLFNIYIHNMHTFFKVLG